MSQPPYPDESHTGQPGYPPPPYGPPPYGPPPGPGQPPAYGAPPPGQPTYDEPTSVQPAYGAPAPGQPAPGQPAPGQPASGPPGYPPPGYDQPSFGQPTSIQPGYDQPSFGQPTSSQPGYPQQGYGQPGYPQPGYGQPGYPPMGTPGPPLPPPKGRSRALPIVLVSVGVVLVLCLGGGVAIFLAARNTVTEATDPVAAPPTGRPSTRLTPEATPAKKISLVEPKTLGGRKKLTDPQFAAIADQLESELGDVPGATNSVGALYGDPADRDIVVIAGVEAPVRNPTQELNGTFLGAGVSGLKVTGLVKVSPGPLGGVAKCGKSTEGGVDLVLCAWADNGSVGWIIWYFKSVNQVKAQFPKLRAQIEKAG